MVLRLFRLPFFREKSLHTIRCSKALFSSDQSLPSGSDMTTSSSKLWTKFETNMNSQLPFPDTSYSDQERKRLRTYGLTPPNVESHQLQNQRCLKQLASKTSPLEKYLYLSNLRNTNKHLFYRLLTENFSIITPLVYTPVVGEACLRWSEIYQYPEGLYISYRDRGSIVDVLRNWRQSQVLITVVTDGSRILGLGDLGVNGMGIPVGKLALYTGCAGIKPEATLPLLLDLGTNNKELLNDKFYMGTRMRRISEEKESEFLSELMVALNTVWPGNSTNEIRIIVQFEDFKNPFPSLEKYGPKYACFNDDIQGTGAVILAGIISALKLTNISIKNQRAVLMGAGSAATGVAKQIVSYFMNNGLSEDEARRKFWLVDTKGLITNDRGDELASHKKYFSRPDNNGRQYKTLSEVIDYVQPTILMGLSAQTGVFNESIIRKMALFNKKPIIMPLSNPSNNSECTFEEAMKWSDGRVIFASGSPFPPYMYNGKLNYPSQGNNMYVFPGIGLGSILSKTKLVKNEMIYASAIALSMTLKPEELADRKLYPEIDRIREVSVIVAREVIREAQRQGLDGEPSARNLTNSQLDNWIRDRMYDPRKLINSSSVSSHPVIQSMSRL
ncbi:NADP-dependent malic enzyme [Golovinomyces cichoracearum]|uniref:Malic enzyme n=1 Tax=Golovinomyces cichoracearum TaxID=62708 RepID=A0A420HGT8_9PEZI|nr:NADP-dependent malic enzyme [Golovinomyces cichoracearum]